MTTAENPHCEKTTPAPTHNAVDRFRQIVSRVRAEDLLCCCQVHLQFHDPEGSQDQVPDLAPVMMELCAFETSTQFGKTDAGALSVSDVGAALDLLASATQTLVLETAESNEADGNEPLEIQKLNRIMRWLTMNRRLVRGTAFPDQTTTEIKGIQGAFDQWFSEKCGISPTRMCDILWAIVGRAEKIATDACNKGAAVGEAFEEAFNQDTPFPVGDGTNVPIRTVFANRRAAKAGGIFLYAYKDVAEKLPVDLHDLNQSSGLAVSEAEWQAMKELLGLTPERRKALADSFQLQRHPVVVFPDGRVVLLEFSNALDQTYEAFEKLAASDKAFFDDKYSAARGEWLEQEAVKNLRALFPEAHVYRSLHYEDPDKSSKTKPELDIAVYWEPFLILCECKASKFDIPTTFGDAQKTSSQLFENVRKAYEQAERAIRFIEKNTEATFREAGTGRTFTVAKSSLHGIFSLNVTLHHLAQLTTQLRELTPFNLESWNHFPLSVSVADLALLCAGSEFPDVFVHYLQRRQEVQRDWPATKSDELELFGAYLTNRLSADRLTKVEKTGKRADLVALFGFQQIFTELMQYRRGERREKPILKLNVPEEIQNVLNELRARPGDAGARSLAVRVLNMSETQLADFSATLRAGKKIVPMPGKADTVMSLGAGLPASVVVSNHWNRFGHDVVRNRAMLHKYQSHSVEAISLGMELGSPRYFQHAVYLNYPWQQDDTLEAAVKAQARYFTGVDKRARPGPNDLCICGSGKKFKKCCGPTFGQRSNNAKGL